MLPACSRLGDKASEAYLQSCAINGLVSFARSVSVYLCSDVSKERALCDRECSNGLNRFRC